jgi:hypothetical protein
LRDRCGFLNEAEVARLAAHPLSRLWPLLVRCGGCRFIAGAQDVARLSGYVTLGGDYVRDVSFPVQEAGR